MNQAKSVIVSTPVGGTLGESAPSSDAHACTFRDRQRVWAARACFSSSSASAMSQGSSTPRARANLRAKALYASLELAAEVAALLAIRVRTNDSHTGISCAAARDIRRVGTRNSSVDGGGLASERQVVRGAVTPRGSRRAVAERRSDKRVGRGEGGS
eukprot:scaffold36761_cov31-Tisochrysis_lutea.AAC.4